MRTLRAVLRVVRESGSKRNIAGVTASACLRPCRLVTAYSRVCARALAQIPSAAVRPVLGCEYWRTITAAEAEKAVGADEVSAKADGAEATVRLVD